MIKWKRPLYMIHRWLGIVLCAFFMLWFVSGIFMMYVEYPQLSRLERLTALPTLDFSNARLAPAEAVSRLQARDFAVVGTPSRNLVHAIDGDAEAAVNAAGVRLAMLQGRPAYVVQVSGPAQPRAAYADDGTVLENIDARTAIGVAETFAARAYPGRSTAPRHGGLIQTDQWSVSAALNAHRPLHRIALGDAAGTELYVSSVTGEVVRDSHRRERWLNLPAAVTHWLYPVVIRRYPDAWAWMVDILASFGVLLALTGLWVGVLRWKRRSQPGKSSIPYRGVMRWHHITGLVFGLVALTWVFSGLLSMNPGDLNPSRTPLEAERQVYSGKALTPGDFALPALAGAEAVEAELMHYLGRPYYLATLRDGSTRLLPGDPTAAGPLPTADAMLTRASALMPTARVASTQVLQAFDNYYYTRRPENGSRPLPVIRVGFDDDLRTWFHLDPVRGQVLERSTRINRLYRWLYNGLHSFDILWLWERRPLWDIVVIAFSLGGAALSMLGVIAGWRRLRGDLGWAKPVTRHAATAASPGIAVVAGNESGVPVTK